MIIGIAGRSCSGKSVIARKLEAYLNNSVLICQDSFFKKHSHNFESPDSLNNWNLAYSLGKLRIGKPTHIPSKAFTEVYDRLINPSQIVIVEGFLLYIDPVLAGLIDKRIYIDVTDENMVKRRLNRNKEFEDPHYVTKVVSESYKHTGIQRSFSDIVIDGNKSIDDVYKDVLNFLQLENSIKPVCTQSLTNNKGFINSIFNLIK